MLSSVSPGLTSATRDVARRRLERIARALARACYRQLFVGWAWQALFWLLLAMASAVLVHRLGWLGSNGAIALGLVLVVTLSGSAVRAFRRRPSVLQVVIEADVRLKLQQTLSTAWEVAGRRADKDLADRLAVHAMRRRIPNRVQHIFPLRVNLWGRLTPGLVALLVLGAVVELDRADVVAPFVEAESSKDQAVSEEGARLLEFARGMRARSTRRELPRSRDRSNDLYHLAVEMQQGNLNRVAAVDGLASLAKAVRADRLQAMQDAMFLDAGALGRAVVTTGPDSGTKLRDLALDDLLERLGGKGLDGTSLRRLDALSRELERYGFVPRGLRAALERYRAGDAVPLKAFLEQMQHLERLLGDANELAGAQVRIRRARRNLGDRDARDIDLASQSSSATSPEGLGFEATIDDPLTDDPGQGGNPVAANAAGNDPGKTRIDPRWLEMRDLAEGKVAVRPKSEFEDVLVLGVQSRILPRVRPVTGPVVELDRRFARQMEAVLAKEDYPRHRKELIRRYFLALSRGAGSSPGMRASPLHDKEKINDR